MKSVAIIGSGILAKELAERAKEIGIQTHCFSFDDKDVACEYVDYFHKINIFDIETIVSICKQEGISGVIATTELTILPAAEVAYRIGALGNSIETAKDITNKYLTRKKLDKLEGLFQPKYSLYSGGPIPKIDKFPVIIKPISAGGKRGISVLYKQEDVDGALIDALKYSRINGVIIEEFINGGQEYSVETLSYKGQHYVVQITEKDTSGPPHCNELGHHQPANLSKIMRDKVTKIIGRMLDAVKITNGPSHTEIKIVDGDVYLIEINDRPGGDHITFPLTELSTDYPYMSAILWASLGILEGHEPQNLKSYYAGIFFVTDKTALLEKIYNDCEKYSWLYYKNKVNDGLSKITFNNEEGLNYFIYYSKTQDPSNFIKNYHRR